MPTLLTVYILFFVAFALYFSILYSRQRIEGRLAHTYGAHKANIYYLGIEKLSGFISMLVLPLIGLKLTGKFNPGVLGIEFTNIEQTLIWWAILGGIALIVNRIRAGKPANHSIYPQIRAQEWTAGLLTYYILGWALYLLGYEFLFRGILFFSGITILPLWLNILINCVLYAIAHLPKGKLEIIASLPFGVILCLVSYTTGNFWAAWLIHLTLALSNSMIALRANPQMVINLRKF